MQQNATAAGAHSDPLVGFKGGRFPAGRGQGRGGEGKLKEGQRGEGRGSEGSGNRAVDWLNIKPFFLDYPMLTMLQ